MRQAGVARALPGRPPQASRQKPRERVVFDGRGRHQAVHCTTHHDGERSVCSCVLDRGGAGVALIARCKGRGSRSSTCLTPEAVVEGQLDHGVVPSSKGAPLQLGPVVDRLLPHPPMMSGSECLPSVCPCVA